MAPQTEISQIPPAAATVLKRMIREGYLSSNVHAKIENSLAVREDPSLRLLVSKGLAIEVSAGHWEPSDKGRMIDLSNAAPDIYEIVSSYANQTPKANFIAVCNGIEAVFEVAEHATFGRGWLVRDVETQEIFTSSSLKDIRPLGT